MTDKVKDIVFVLVAVFFAAALGGCGNPLEGGSEPSGSLLFISDLSYSTTQQDLFFCEGESVAYATMNFTVTNESRPNTPEGSSTNSRVTLTRYRVDYTVLNLSARIPSLDGAGIGGTIQPGGQDDFSNWPLITEAQLQHIRANYPQIGNGEAMNVRFDVTVFGRDEFQVNVTAEFSGTLTIDDFNPCAQDLPPADESET